MLAFLKSFLRSAPVRPVPFCRDCRWREAVDLHPKCQSPQAARTNVVTGEIEQHYCSVARMEYLINLCGKQARWFEPRA